jgi:hypothetical protein
MVDQLMVFKKAGRRQPIAGNDPQGSIRRSDEESQYDRSQRGALDESSCDQHGRTDINHSLRLTGDGFHGLATDLSDTDTGAKYGESGTNCG